MSTSQKQLIDAIRRIAKSDPEVETLLKAFANRGTLKGGKFFDAPQSDDSCCSGEITQVGEPGDEGTGTGAADTSGDAPPDMSGGTPEGWSDCETGAAIQFTPAGFVQPETCKECEPDPSYEDNFFWYTSSNGGRYSSLWPYQVLYAAYVQDQSNSSPYFRNVTTVPCGYEHISNDLYRLFFCSTGERRPTTSSSWGPWSGTDLSQASKRMCVGVDATRSYCTDPYVPEICGEDWTPDSTTNYTLANGCITGSSCDPDATEQAKQCNEQIKICDENGNERIIQSIGNGQFIMYDPSGEYKGGRYNSATGERLEILDPGSNGGYGSIE